MRTIALELYADLVCPWCWIGDRRLHAALARVRDAHPDVTIELTWRPFLLDPTIPPEGYAWEAFVAQKFGSLAEAEPMFARLREAGANDGLTFAFDRMTRAPSTRRGHALLLHVQQGGMAPWALVDRLFAAHFRDGEDIGDPEVLVRHAVAAGVDAQRARTAVTDGRYDLDIDQSQREAARLGIRGVPFVVVDGRYGVSGAQPLAVFAQAVTRAITDVAS